MLCLLFESQACLALDDKMGPNFPEAAPAVKAVRGMTVSFSCTIFGFIKNLMLKRGIRLYLTLSHVDGAPIEIEVRYNQRSKSMKLRLDKGHKRVILTLPPRTSALRANAFLERSRNWLLEKLNQQPPHIPFMVGSIISIFGQDYTICYLRAPQSKIELKGDKLLMQGPTENLSYALKSWLKHHAHDYLNRRCQGYAGQIGQKINYIRVREVKSRWGSCSHQANLSFSWRLVFAPLPVVDYVCAHEVAHLAEMNHSQKFWAVVESICPNPKTHIRWLKKNSQLLFSYGEY